MRYRLQSVLAVLAAVTLFFTACTEKEAPNSKSFAVGNGHFVEFSPGNLRYRADSNIYRFASHQYDMCGMGNQNIAPAYAGWIDLFGWGTGKTPTMAEESDSLYANFNDWGENPIAGEGTGWRTLSYEEWDYILNQRTNAAALRGAATVHGINGLIVLPDKWAGDPLRGSMTRFSDNDFTDIPKADSVWEAWEAQGAIFLPAAGQREGKKVFGSTTDGRYWTSTHSFYNNAYFVGFMNPTDRYSQRRSIGRSVRLVKDVQ